MSDVAKTGSAAAPPSGAGRPEAGERDPKGGTFDKVLEAKGRGERTEAREGTGERHSSATGERATRGSGSSARDVRGGREAGEPRDWRALPGDVAVPSRAPAGAAPAVPGSRAAEAVARVERIAEQIVRAVEVRLGPAGTAEVRLQLDLGALGQLQVAMQRDAEGTLTVRLDAAGAEASRLLADQGGDLVARLEARGLALREVVMTSADGSLVRIASPSEAATAELSARLAEDAARRREQTSSRQPGDRERRGHGGSDRAEEEEDE